MKVNYKNLFYIFHLNGKFTEEELKEVLDAAYEEGRKKGYDDGFKAGKNSHFTITYPTSNDWWTKPYYEITCNNKTGDAVIPTITTATNTNPPSVITTTSGNMTISKSQSPYGMEFKYNGTEK